MDAMYFTDLFFKIVVGLAILYGGRKLLWPSKKLEEKEREERLAQREKDQGYQKHLAEMTMQITSLVVKTDNIGTVVAAETALKVEKIRTAINKECEQRGVIHFQSLSKAVSACRKAHVSNKVFDDEVGRTQKKLEGHDDDIKVLHQRIDTHVETQH